MRHIRLLIVDDEASVRAMLEGWFARRGFAVDTASDGIGALEKCERNEYDLITMDFQMPGMNGCEAILSIRALRPDVPIIVLTGCPSDAGGAIICGASKVIAKPAHMRMVEREVRSLVCGVEKCN